MKALFIGAHTDDVEIACGGILQRFSDKKILVFSPAIESIPKGFDSDCTKKEFMKSCKISNSQAELFSFPVRRLSEYRQEILEILVKTRNKYKPDVVFTHCSTDSHQDHKIIHEESVRAFKYNNLFGYTISPNNVKGTNFNFFAEMDDKMLKQKIKLISCYKSQLAKKDLISEVKINAKFYGTIIGQKYAEPFEVIRGVIYKQNV